MRSFVRSTTSILLQYYAYVSLSSPHENSENADTTSPSSAFMAWAFRPSSHLSNGAFVNRQTRQTMPIIPSITLPTSTREAGIISTKRSLRTVRHLYVDGKDKGSGVGGSGIPPTNQENATLTTSSTLLIAEPSDADDSNENVTNIVDIARSTPEIAKLAKGMPDNTALFTNQYNDESQHHSMWYDRYVKYMKDLKTTSDSSESSSSFAFVLTDKEKVGSDFALNLLSSEIGVKECFVGRNPFTGRPTGTTSKDINDLPINTLLERTFDTLEDIWEHLRRLPYENGYATITPAEDATRKTILVLGSGWGAHAFMKVANCNKLRVIVVSPSNHFVFTPMLASAATGTVEYRSMTEAVRSANGMIEEYIEGKATGVDLEKRKVRVRLNSLLEEFREGDPPEMELEYDHLVVAVGCKVDTKGVPGASRSLRLKSCDDARRLRTAVGECLEYASRPDVAGSDPERQKERTQRATFLIVGGGPTGVELAGELYDLAEDVTRPHKGPYPKLRGNVSVVLCHSGDELVPQFDKPLRADALKSLEKKGIKVILNTRVTEVGDGFARLSTKKVDDLTGEVTREDSVLPVGLSVWCAGTAPVSFVSQLLDQLPESARNSDGRIRVDKYLRPPMKDPKLLGSVIVIGDAAATMEDGEYLPQTAQVAGQQGAYVARLLSRGYDLDATPPALPSTPLDDSDVFYDPQLTQWLKIRGLDVASKFSFLNLGLLAYLGGNEALSQVQMGDFPLFAYSGSVAFVLWRSVYLVKQVATKNRILVTFDWIKSALFGRDMTRL